MKTFCSILLAIASFLPTAATAQTTSAKADKVQELMKSAFQKYQKNDLNGASTDLEEAKKLIDARRQDFAVTLFPEVDGWKATKAEKEDAAVIGGTRLHRNYESKGKSILAEIIIDSPMIEKLAPLLNNPTIAEAGGFESRRIEGKEALIKPAGQKIELNIWVGSGILFKLTGDDTKENELVTFAKKFDFKAMDKLKKEPAAAKP